VTALERLSAEDTRILRLESERIAGHTCKVMILREARDTEAVRAHMAARVGRAPGLTRRIVPTPLGVANPVWVHDESFELERHVRPAAASRPVGREHLRALVAEVLERRLPRDRPLWSIDVVERLAGGGSALIWLMHHAAADGASCMRIAEEVLWDDEPPGAAPAKAGEGAADGDPSAARLLAAGLSHRASGVAGAAAGAARTLASPARLRRAAGELGRMPGTVRRELAPLRAASPFDRPLGPNRAVAFTARPLDDLRRIEHALEGHVTVNDVLLAVVARGVGAWLRARGLAIGAMRAKVPVSMHPAHEQPDALGNRDSFLFVDLAMAQPDPIAQLRAINAETARRKALHDPGTLYTLLNDLTHVAAPLARAASHLAASPRAFTFTVSNVRGPAQPVAVAGAPLAELWSLAEVAPRHALRVAGVSLAGDFGIGLTTDPSIAPDVAGLAAAVERAGDELLEAVG
jgi:WS/DGAT/MGAT family acyltransferase